MAYRVQHRFWLDIERDDEAAINDEVVHLKQNRSFAATIRDGIRLICDLRSGKLDVLFELFPWVRAEFLEYMQTLPAPGGNSDDGAVQRRLDQLERLLLAQDNGRVMSSRDDMAGVPGPQGPKPLAGPQGPKPLSVPKPNENLVRFDDDDLPALVVTRSKAAGNTASANFLSSAYAIAGMQ